MMAEPIITGGTFIAACGAILAVGYYKRKSDEQGEDIQQLWDSKVSREEFTMLQGTVRDIRDDVREVLKRLS